MLYYLSGYLFTVLGAFTVICLVLRQVDGEDIGALAGLHRRSPLLAATMTLAMVSLAGIPPLAGFFGKFLLLQGRHRARPRASRLLLPRPSPPLAGVVISLYYYFGVVRAIYWSSDPPDLSPIPVSRPIRVTIYGCIAGMLYLGLYPSPVLNLATEAVKALR